MSIPLHIKWIIVGARKQSLKMGSWSWCCLCALAIWLSTVAADDIFTIPKATWQFESLPGPKDNWRCVACELSSHKASHDGERSVKISNRTDDWSSIEITVTVEPGDRYFFSAYFRLLNQLNGFVVHEVHLRALLLDAGSQIAMLTLASAKHETMIGDFRQISGDFLVPNGVNGVTFRLFIPEFEIEYLFDHAELFKVRPQIHWRRTLDKEIRSNRQSEILVIPKIKSIYNPLKFRFEISKVSSTFGFGTAISERNFLNSANAKYKEFVLNYFNWVTPANHVKWRQVESQQGSLDYSIAEQTLSILEANGIASRGHTILFNAAKNNPSWVQTASGQDLSDMIDSRVNGVVSQFEGRFSHWDIVNEHLADNFYEKGTGRTDVLHEAFRQASAVDPKARLFMNEYGVFKDGGRYTQPYINAVRELRKAKVPIWGIGVEASITDGEIDIPLFRRRLNALKDMGLPIWITELTVSHPDMAIRAQGYEDLLRLFYSHPSIQGIITWGFWDGDHYAQNATMAEGPDITLNEAGQKFFGLWETWNTNDFSVSFPRKPKNTKFVGHHGVYVARLYMNNVLIDTKEFGVARGSNVNIEVIVKRKRKKMKTKIAVRYKKV